MLEVLVISLILVGIAFLGLGIRVIFKKNGQFSGGSCSAPVDGREKEFSCGCSGSCEKDYSFE